MTKRIIALIICFSLCFEQTGIAQVAGQFAMPAYLSNLPAVADRFRPVQLRSIEFDPSGDNAQLLLDKGDDKNLNQGQIGTASRKLFEYFRIGLALPNSMFWVNLRPDSPDNIIDPYLEKTDLGKVLLEADLQLKKDLARFTDPSTPEGRQYWDKLYTKAEQIYGLEDMEIPTVTRPWIVPGEIIIRTSEKGAFIYKATLKVMLEQDYLKDSQSFKFGDPGQKEINNYSSQLIRELIIPKLTKEVNSSKRYAQLRQVYYSLILAQWFKTKAQWKNIENKDLTGLTSKTAWSKDSYYQAYRRSFQNGEYKREERVNTSDGLTIRQYFSGGMILNSGAADGGSSFTVIQGRDMGDLGSAGAFLRLTMSGDGGTKHNDAEVLAGVREKLAANRLQDIDWLPGGLRQAIEKDYNRGRPLKKINLFPDQAGYVDLSEFKDIADDEYVYSTVVEFVDAEYTSWPSAAYTPAYHYKILIAPKATVQAAQKYSITDVSREKNGAVFVLQLTFMPYLNGPQGAIKWDKIAITSELENNGYSSGTCAVMGKMLSENFPGAKIMVLAVDDKVSRFFAREFESAELLRPRPKKDSPLSLENDEVLEAIVSPQKEDAVARRDGGQNTHNIPAAVKSFFEANGAALSPLLGLGGSAVIYAANPLLFTWFISAAPAALAVAGAFISTKEYRRAQKTDPARFLMAQGNPFSITNPAQSLALGLDGIVDMPAEIIHRKGLINLSRAMYDLPVGFIWFAMELSIDLFNGLRTGKNILKNKFEIMRLALLNSSGINPLKIMYMLFPEWCFAKDDFERRFMVYETTLLHARTSSDHLAPKEDTYRNNTFLAGEAAFYHMLKQLKLEEFDNILAEMESRNSILFSRSQIKKKSVKAQDIINLYLAERSRIWEDRRDRGLTGPDRALGDFLYRYSFSAQPKDRYILLSASIAGEMTRYLPYYGFTVLKLLDKHFNDTFDATEIPGTPKYDRFLEMTGSAEESPDRVNAVLVSGLTESGIIGYKDGKYFLTEGFKQEFMQLLESGYSEITGKDASGVPEYEGVLHVNGKLYRWVARPPAAQGDGGKAGEPETDGSYSPASPDSVSEYPAEKVTENDGRVLWGLYKRIFPYAQDMGAFLEELKDKTILVYREPGSPDITGYLTAQPQPGDKDEIYVRNVAVSEYEFDPNKPPKRRARALLLKLIQLMQARGKKRLMITASKLNMKMAVESLSADGYLWKNIPEKNPITGRDQTGNDYILELGSKDGGFYERAVADQLRKFMDMRDPAAKAEKARVFSFEFAPDFIKNPDLPEKERFRNRLNAFIDHLPVAIDKKIVRPEQGEESFIDIDALIDELCGHAFDGIVSLTALTPEAELVGRRIDVYFSIRQDAAGKKLLEISVEDNGAGEKSLKPAEKVLYITKGLNEINPYIKWNDNWRKLLAEMVDRVNEYEHGGLAAGYKELTGREPGQINSFIVELPVGSLVLTGYDLNYGADQLDGGFKELVVNLHRQVGEPIKGGDDYRIEPVYVNLLAEEYGVYRMKQFNPVSYPDISERMTQLENKLNHIDDGALKGLTLWEKAAWIMKEYYKIHPFIDGNKRTAMRLIGAYLKDLGFPMEREIEYLKTVSDQLTDAAAFTPEMTEYYAALGQAVFNDDISKLAALFEAGSKREIPQYIILKIPNPHSFADDIIAIKIDISELRKEVEKFGIDRVTGMLESIAATTLFYSYRDYVDKLINALRNQPDETKKDRTGSQDGGSELEDVAGVDFRGLPVGGQPAQMPVMMPQLEKLAQCSKMSDMDKEWLGIQREMAASAVPYEKIKEYIAVCMNKPDCRKHLDKAAACLISILRIEEEQALPTRSELKDLLVCLG